MILSEYEPLRGRKGARQIILHLSMSDIIRLVLDSALRLFGQISVTAIIKALPGLFFSKTGI